MRQWLTQDTAAGVHVMPLDDLILHTQSEGCTCRPSIRLEGTTCSCTGPKLYARKVIIHEAMDGRR